jgi:hypothetical protein
MALVVGSVRCLLLSIVRRADNRQTSHKASPTRRAARNFWRSGAQKASKAGIILEHFGSQQLLS